MMELEVDGTKQAGERNCDAALQPCAPYIETATGGQFWYFDRGCDETDIRIEDIAHHLAQESRFAGATSCRYSVARHSVNVWAEFVKRNPGAEPAEQLLALLHDGHEAYTKDLPKPLRQLPQLAGFNELAADVQRRIEQRFRARGAVDVRREIKQIDLVLLRTEARALMPSGGARWGWPAGVEAIECLHNVAEHLDWHIDRRDFLEAFLSCW